MDNNPPANVGQDGPGKENNAQSGGSDFLPIASLSIAQKKPQQPKEANKSKIADGSQKQSIGEQAASVKSKVPDQIEMKPSDNEIDQQIEMLKSKLFIPKRIDLKTGSKLGRLTEVQVNHLELNLDKLFKQTVYHIECQFTPDLSKPLLRITALKQFVDKHYRGILYAFDGGKNMYTTKELNGKTDLITVLNEKNGTSIDVSIVTSLVNEINMSNVEEYLKNGSSICPPREAFQALNIILKNRSFSLGFTNAGRAFFPVPRNLSIDLGEGMELWQGFVQSPVMGWKPYLNIDVAWKEFPKHQLLTSYIQEELNCSLNEELDDRTKNILANYVKGLKIEFVVPNQPRSKRIYKVVGLLDCAARFEFELSAVKSGNKNFFTVFQYFKNILKYVIKYPYLPCLHVGNVNKKYAIPIELCTILKGQLQMKKLTESQKARRVKFAVGSPAERQRNIENSIRDIKFNEDPVLREFGIEVDENFASIPARVLDQPSLAYFENKETIPKSGIWKVEKFSKAVKVERWIVLNLDACINYNSIRKFEILLIQSGGELNVQFDQMDPVCNINLQRNAGIDAIEKRVENFFNVAKQFSPSFELVVVIIPDNPQGIYAAVKKASELQVGMLTQCIKSSTMLKMNIPTAKNILLKINSKLNGINHTLSDNSCPNSMKGAIIFGADITHPAPDQTTVPSVAAVAASHDLAGSQYNMEWRLQCPNVEIIQDLEDIVHKQLLKYKEKTNTVPLRIFYFRGGVSDGQFVPLLDHELIAIRRACLRLNIKYQPSITFVVVQKRHQTRIFPIHSEDMDGRNQNVPSGTIIDTQITHPTEVDFYLCSHASVQGTSKPTKYHLIWDDNNFTEDELKQVTFHLCFMFVRCTRSVSYPAPTYYAHLAAVRARVYIENKKINLNRLDEEQIKNQINDLFISENPMFFV